MTVIIETLTVQIGGAMLKALVSHWLGDGEKAGLAADVTDISTATFLSAREKGRARRALERLTEKVAESLEEPLNSEFRSVDEGEVLAAIAAVQDTLARMDFSTGVIVQVSLDADRLTARLMENDPRRTSVAQLDEGGGAVYRFLLRAVATYLVEIAPALPSFQGAAVKELLARDEVLYESLNSVLERVVGSLTPGIWGVGDDNSRFETEYLRRIRNELDRLELFGVDLEDHERRYRLSVAYIGLSGSPVTSLQADETFGVEHAAIGPESLVPVERLLSQSDRLIIRGWAGSGKTTLLQWIAVSLASHSLPEALEKWNGRIPFFLQLRRWVGTDWPRPEEFLKYVAPNLTGAMPQGWVHRVLAEGRGVVLVDGVDEVPDGERRAALSWLESLLQQFPQSIFVVTSRPPALSNSWLALDGFKTTEIQPMELPDIRAFITHWHHAMFPAHGSESERRELDSIRDLLQARVRDSAPLRSLASTPLLCALICTLNRTRRAKVPESRMDLYRIAIEVLTTRRDPERNVYDPVAEQVSPEQQMMLLEEIARWLIENGRSDLAVAKVDELIAQQRPSLTGVTASPDELRIFLLTRSGLLREPVVGAVDFIHRTFLEYLAARWMVARQDIPKLVKNAMHDQWREVIILACGHATPRQRGEILNGLLDRADRQPRNAQAIRVLAISCLESIKVLDPEVRTRMEGVMEDLLPPTRLSDAVAVAAAGDQILPYLRHASRKAPLQAACVRALVRIGTAQAMEELKPYGSDTRVTVVRELVKGFGYFPPSAYAERVLADSPLDSNHLEIRDPSIVSDLKHLKHLKYLSASFSSSVSSIEDFRELPPVLFSLSVQGSRAITSLEAIREQKNLQVLDVTRTGVRSLSPLRDMELISLVCSRSPITSFAGLESSPLQTLVADGVPATSLNGVVASELRHVSLNDASIRDLTALEGAGSLTRFLAINLVAEDYDLLGGAPLLKVIVIPRAKSLEFLSVLSELEFFTGFAVGQDQFESACRATALKTLNISLEGGRISLGAISTLQSLTSLTLRNESQVDISPLLGLPALEKISFTGEVDDLVGVSEHGSLTEVHVSGDLSAKVTREFESRDWVVLGTRLYLPPGVSASSELRNQVSHQTVIVKRDEQGKVPPRFAWLSSARARADS